MLKTVLTYFVGLTAKVHITRDFAHMHKSALADCKLRIVRTYFALIWRNKTVHKHDYEKITNFHSSALLCAVLLYFYPSFFIKIRRRNWDFESCRKKSLFVTYIKIAKCGKIVR